LKQVEITTTDAVEKFTELLSSSVQKRLRSDVPIGTSLSGGIDSSAIVAFCNQNKSESYSHQCFTASFSGFEKDETVFAKQVAQTFGLEQHIVEIRDTEIVNLMGEVMRHQEEPFSSSSVLAQYCVYSSARQNGIKVLLDGQGADEVLGGYHKYYKWYWQELFRNRKLGTSKEKKQAESLGIKETFNLKNKVAAILPDFSAGIWQGRKIRQAFQQRDLEREFAFHHKRSLYHALPPTFDLNGVLYFDTFMGGLEELLRLADRNSMSHGTEVRLPFLSHELVEFLFSLPSHYKIHDGWTKWLLRKSVENLLPENITWRKDKTGFEPPQKKWMQQKPVQEAIMEGKKKLAGKGIIDKDAVKKIQPHHSYAAENMDWKYWSASYLFD
jgi:asparagine synthase (glutamine-hydrolysing)